MKTKLVYVLTCAEEATYIEQSLISIWSARYHNPQAIIILLVDDLTKKLLVGARSEVLLYVTECIVIDLPPEMPMLERSRFIKTSVRKIINGDFLFIDSDTIICRSLCEIDKFQNIVGAVLDNHMSLEQYPQYLYNHVKKRLETIQVDISKEKFYFSSGVMYVKDDPLSHKLYEKWFKYWHEGLTKPFIGDQPYLCKADIELNHLIKELPREWNCVMYTYPTFDRDAFILHFSVFQNMNFLFDKNCLLKIRRFGLSDYMSIISSPRRSYISHVHQKFIESYTNIYEGLKFINDNTPNSIDTYLIKYNKKRFIIKLINNSYFRLASFCICILIFLQQIKKYISNIKKQLTF